MIADSVDVSPDLVRWSASAGMTVIQGSVAIDQRSAISSKGGESRYYIAAAEGPWYIVTSSDRMGPEFLVFGATSMAVIEIYFFAKFGRSIRNSQKLPLLDYPLYREQLDVGYSLSSITLDGRTLPLLKGTEGGQIAMGSTSDLVEISTYIGVSTAILMKSFLDPSGNPLSFVENNKSES